jgi:hypothetical protein
VVSRSGDVVAEGAAGAADAASRPTGTAKKA